jgi:hypothetical protein
VAPLLRHRCRAPRRAHGGSRRRAAGWLTRSGRRCSV